MGNKYFRNIKAFGIFQQIKVILDNFYLQTLELYGLLN